MKEAKHEIITLEENADIVITYIDNQVAMKYAKTMGINSIPLHWHRSIEFSYIRKGSVNVWLHNKLTTLQEGDFIFVNSAEVHAMSSDNIAECEIVLTIIPYTTLKQFLPNIDELSFDIYKNKQYPMRFYEIFEFFYEYTQDPKPYDRLKMNSYIFELIHILCTQYQSNEKDIFTHRKIQHQLLDYIEQNYKKDLTLQSLSEAFYFNPEYLSRKFKELFGVNFKSYLTQYRLQQALYDVIYSDETMQDIAYSYGFTSIKTFILSFKQHFGITPYQYRIHYRQK